MERSVGRPAGECDSRLAKLWVLETLLEVRKQRACQDPALEASGPMEPKEPLVRTGQASHQRGSSITRTSGKGLRHRHCRMAREARDSWRIQQPSCPRAQDQGRGGGQSGHGSASSGTGCERNRWQGNSQETGGGTACPSRRGD